MVENKNKVPCGQLSWNAHENGEFTVTAGVALGYISHI